MMNRFARAVSGCKSAEMHHKAQSEAKPGDSVGFNVRNVTSITSSVATSHRTRRTRLRLAARTSRRRSSPLTPRAGREGPHAVLDCYTRTLRASSTSCCRGSTAGRARSSGPSLSTSRKAILRMFCRLNEAVVR